MVLIIRVIIKVSVTIEERFNVLLQLQAACAKEVSVFDQYRFEVGGYNTLSSLL